MRPYLGLAFLWLMSAYSFMNSYYAFRFPEKYMKAGWTVRRGLPPEPSSASAGGVITIVLGAFFFGLGFLVLHGLLF